ncbi:MAG TPA: dephospho-CoA kinase [Dehalococcoidia bacterium]|nr:dephospho-CoA kinase [Dehalococcoidia bacterium]
MIKIGLTGGIASGKSTVSAMLLEMGAHIIDADKVGHEAYEPGTKVWEEVVAAFGQDVVGENGAIDRKRLGPIVFNDPDALQRLNAIVHPRMKEMIAQRFEELERAGNVQVAVLEAAILIEAHWESLVDEIWVTAVPEEVAKDRLMARNGLTPEQAESRIRSQLSNEERIAHADSIIDTSVTIPEVRVQVERLWGELSERAASASATH